MVVATIVVIIVVVAVDGKSFTKEQYFDELYNALEKTKIMLDKTNYIKSRVNLETYLKKYYSYLNKLYANLHHLHNIASSFSDFFQKNF